MSSHHFVRDGQEPALIIANGESCSLSILNQLLEWNPYVLVLDGAISRVVELNIRFDGWLGDFDSAPHIENLREQFGNIEVVHTPDQSKTDLQKGIEFICSKGFKDANIVWATGRRADHTFQNLATLPLYAAHINLNIIDDYSKVFNLPRVFKKWYPANTKISLFPVEKAGNISTRNLSYNLSNESLELPYRTGSSNFVEDDGFVEISYTEGSLLMMECRD